MKKISGLLLAIVLCFVLVLGFSSCEQLLGTQQPPNESENEDKDGDIPAHTHQLSTMRENTINSTCTAEGSYDLVEYCTLCGEKLSRTKKTIPKVQHTTSTPIKENEIPATCTEGGSYENVYCCTICEFEVSRKNVSTVPNGHTYKTVDNNIGQCSCKICGEEITVSVGLGFYSNGDGTCSVYRMGDCTDTDIIIPLISPNGDAVTGIGDDAFRYDEDIKSITLLDNIINLGKGMFLNCDNLSCINVEPSNPKYKSIDGNLYTKDGTKLVKYAPGKQESTFIFPENVERIGNEAFYGCQRIISMIIPNSIIGIGDYAFYNCNSLTNIVLGVKLSYIGEKAFVCEKLYKITDRSNLNLKFGSTDNGSIALHSVMINGNSNDSDTTLYYETEDGFIFKFENDEYTLLAYVGSEDTITLPVNFNDNSYKIDRFTGAPNVIIPEGITSIDESAFYDCKVLNSVTIPDSVTSIGKNAFYGCEALSSADIPNSVTSIGDYAFYNCKLLSSVAIPDNVTRIGEYTFYGCELLKSIDIPNGVTSIGGYAFYGCNNLVSVCIPNTITYLSSSTFGNCLNIEFNNYDNAKYLGNDATPYLVLISATQKDISSCMIHDDTRIISGGAFYNCVALSRIVIPDNVVHVGVSAFEDCYSLTNVTIGENVKVIEDYAFYDCSCLVKVTNKTDLVLDFMDRDHGDVAYNALFIIEKNGDVRFSRYATAQYIETEDNFLFRIKDGKPTLIAYLGPETTVTLPKDYSGSSYGILSMRGVSNVIIPKEITDLGESAFYGCQSLKSIVLHDGITSIGAETFFFCKNLTHIEIHGEITSIGKWAFSSCTSLTSLVLPKSLNSVEACAFMSCNALTDIYYTGTETEWSAVYIGSENNVLEKATIHYDYVPEE